MKQLSKKNIRDPEKVKQAEEHKYSARLSKDFRKLIQKDIGGGLEALAKEVNSVA